MPRPQGQEAPLCLDSVATDETRLTQTAREGYEKRREGSEVLSVMPSSR